MQSISEFEINISAPEVRVVQSGLPSPGFYLTYIDPALNYTGLAILYCLYITFFVCVVGRVIMWHLKIQTPFWKVARWLFVVSAVIALLARAQLQWGQH